jgi:hypothetical protein
MVVMVDGLILLSIGLPRMVLLQELNIPMLLLIKHVPKRLVHTSQLVTRQLRLIICKLLFLTTQYLFVLMPQIGVHTRMEYSIIARNQLTMLF